MLHLLWVVPLCALVWAWVTARAFDARVRDALDACRSPSDRVRAAARTLPPAAQRLVDRAGIGSGTAWRVSTIEQEGEMRQDPGRPWLPFRATQVFAADRPEFAWVARFRMPPGLPLRVVDALGPEGGFLEARLFDAIPVARASGATATKGQLMRYLAELAWCPAAVTANPDVTFEERPDGALRARCEHAGVEAHVDLEVDAAGDLVGVRGVRPYATRSGVIDTPWTGRFSEHRDVGGVRMPTRGEVAWRIDGEEFVYWRGRVTAARFG